MNEEISVRKEWFEQLADLAEEVRIDVDKWLDEGKGSMPTSITKLYGYASSARTILAHAPKQEDLM